MGWLVTPGSTRRSMIADQLKGWSRIVENGVLVQSKCLAHCYRGSSFSGLLWCVWEITFQNPDGSIENHRTLRWIQCDQLQYVRRDGGWGCKEVVERMGPYQVSCPLKYLKMVPLDQFGGDAEWRQRVLEHHEQRRERRKALKTG